MTETELLNQVLLAIYEYKDHISFNLDKVCTEKKIPFRSSAQAKRIFDRLRGLGWIRWVDKPFVMLTYLGVQEIERILSENNELKTQSDYEEFIANYNDTDEKINRYIRFFGSNRTDINDLFSRISTKIKSAIPSKIVKRSISMDSDDFKDYEERILSLVAPY